ncbi:MAG: translation elongation factor-like protein [Candidatus Hodarchaeota archaeon]
MSEKIGDIENFFTKISVAVVSITNGSLSKGDQITVKGATTNFEMTVESMQIEREDVESVSAGTKVGLKVPERVRPGDEVFKL